MATASSVSSEQVLTDINEQILLCAICMERFKSPKILPCYHTYCEPCLTEWVKTNNGQLICPTCKESFPLPPGGVPAIANNRFMNDLQQILGDVSTDSQKSVCAVCKNEAKFWCQDCGEFFCDDCVNTHKTMRLLKGHKLMTVDEYKEKMSSEHSRLIQPRFCDKHPSAQLELYCDSCQIPTCVKCTLVEHTPPEHKTLSVEAALEKYVPTMKEYEKKAAQKVSDLKQARDGVLDVGKCLEKNKTTAESQVKDLSKIVIDIIQKQENKLLAEIADTYSPKRKQIDSRVEQLEHRLVGAQSIHSHLNHLLRYGGAVDIMTAKAEIRLRLQQDDVTQEGSDDIDSNIVFTENPPCRLVDLGCVGSKAIYPVNESYQTAYQTLVLSPPIADKIKEGSTLSKKATVGENMSVFMLHVCKYKLIDIEKRKGIEFVYGGGDDIIIKPAKNNTTCTMQDLDDVYGTFVTLVQEYHTKVTSKDVDLANQNVLSSDISEALKDTQSKYGRVLIKQTGDRQYRIIGEEDTTKVAMEDFYNCLGLATPQSRHHGRKRHGARGTQRSNSASDETTFQTSCIVLEAELGYLSKTKVSVRQGDITKEKVDIIVNAANESLCHEGGVAGAIVKAGGYGIQQESYEIMKRQHGKPLQISEVVCTTAGALPCLWILHTVGPVWKTSGKQKVKEALYQCCSNLLSEAGYYGAKSIAIPAIGTGYNEVPKDLCAKVMLDAVLDYVSNHHKNQFKEICFIDVKSDTVFHFETVFEETLRKNNLYYTKPNITGADHLPVSRESSVDGDHYGHRGTTVCSGIDDTIAISTGHVQGAVERYSKPDKGNSTRESSNRDSKSNAKGAIPKTTVTSKSTWSNPLGTDNKAKDCPVCLSQMENPKILPCNHAFCKACIDASEKSMGPTCPICKQAFGIIRGNMPKGEMKSQMSDYTTIPGYRNCGVIIIYYRFPPGIQGPEHPNPGRSYHGDSRTAYLPNNPEGREVLRLLKIAFERRLTFTIGTSVTTGRTDAVVWNDIHHKTAIHGGAQGYGYPDPTYLSRVREELAAKGVK